MRSTTISPPPCSWIIIDWCSWRNDVGHGKLTSTSDYVGGDFSDNVYSLTSLSDCPVFTFLTLTDNRRESLLIGMTFVFKWYCHRQYLYKTSDCHRGCSKSVFLLGIIIAKLHVSSSVHAILPIIHLGIGYTKKVVSVDLHIHFSLSTPNAFSIVFTSWFAVWSIWVSCGFYALGFINVRI